MLEMTRVLLVEDDARIRGSVRLGLEDEGWDVVEAPSGEDALIAMTQAEPDVVLVDLMLPGMSGFEVCRQIRRVSAVGLIMVTARADTHDVVAGLEAGADDYVTKPFEPKELAARIRALLRRGQREGPASASISLGDVEINAAEATVRVRGEEVHLTRTEFQLLNVLAEHRGQVLSREQLLERVWGYGYFGDARLVDVHVRRLRTKIELDSASPQVLLTIRGMGYKIVAP